MNTYKVFWTEEFEAIVQATSEEEAIEKAKHDRDNSICTDDYGYTAKVVSP